MRDLAEVRQRLDLEECKDLKRDLRTFMIIAQASCASNKSQDTYLMLWQGSSQQAQTEALQKKVSTAVAASKTSCKVHRQFLETQCSQTGSISEFNTQQVVFVQSCTFAPGLSVRAYSACWRVFYVSHHVWKVQHICFIFAAHILIYVADPFQDGCKTPHATITSSDAQDTTEDMNEESTAPAALGDPMEMTVFRATGVWIEETANSLASENKDSNSHRLRGIRRVSSLPNL